MNDEGYLPLHHIYLMVLVYIYIYIIKRDIRNAISHIPYPILHIAYKYYLAIKYRHHVHYAIANKSVWLGGIHSLTHSLTHSTLPSDALLEAPTFPCFDPSQPIKPILSNLRSWISVFSRAWRMIPVVRPVAAEPTNTKKADPLIQVDPVA